jgi:hypothetical protein
MNDPAIAETMLMPSARPRCSAGNASVRIAQALANRHAAPTPWITRQTISHRAPALPCSQTIDNRIEPAVNTAKPRL